MTRSKVPQPPSASDLFSAAVRRAKGSSDPSLDKLVRIVQEATLNSGSLGFGAALEQLAKDREALAFDRYEPGLFNALDGERTGGYRLRLTGLNFLVFRATPL